jgi:hypothetical protein
MTGDGESIYGSHYGPSVQKPWDIERFSFCDVSDDRILCWLDDEVQEYDFQNMQKYGDKLLRVPTGYWNWVDILDATQADPEPLSDPEIGRILDSRLLILPVTYDLPKNVATSSGSILTHPVCCKSPSGVL